MVEEYLLVKRTDIQNQMNYYWLNKDGTDITNILRGKLQMLDEILNLRNMFETMDKMEEKLKGANK